MFIKKVKIKMYWKKRNIHQKAKSLIILGQNLNAIMSKYFGTEEVKSTSKKKGRPFIIMLLRKRRELFQNYTSELVDLW